MATARQAAAAAVARQAPHFPDLPPVTVDVAQLDPRDARLAHAIHRATLERWITLTFLLETFLKRDLQSLEPRLQAILLTGAAQLLFFEKTPAHAVVNDAVNLAKRQMREGAGKLVNAVLRKVDQLVATRHDEPWSPAADRLPLTTGYLQLTQPLLPGVRTDEHLAVATSHPMDLVIAWRNRFGDQQAAALLLHSLQAAPVIVHSRDGAPLDPALATPHEQPGFHVWLGDHQHLLQFIRTTSGVVQDPTSSTPVRSTASLRPRHIVDFCAGRGTKTHQLAQLHPEATVSATDPDADRFADLTKSFADHPRVRIVPFAEIHKLDGQADLIVLDVPCSNTGVLARRLEARYRYSAASLTSVADLQRRIITDAAKLLDKSPVRAVLYSTCSIEQRENETQATWAAQHLKLRITHQHTILPGGADTTYHDGGFHALLNF